MTTYVTPAPRPLCSAFAPLLPLISSGALEEDEATPTREHVAGCAWCQQELARYAAVDEALRWQFGAASESTLLFPFDLDGDEDYAFTLEDTLEDTLEETMAEGHDSHDQRPSTTARSSRWVDRKSGPSPRATAIAAVAAALILVIIPTTIFTQIAVRRAPHPAATATPSAFIRIALPNANTRQISQLITAPDGSLWFADSFTHSAKISHMGPDGTTREFPVPAGDRVKNVYIYGLAVGPDGAIWFSGDDFDGSGYTAFVRRMAPDGVFTTIPVPAGLHLGTILTGLDSALWFEGSRELNPAAPTLESKHGVIGRIAPDGRISEYPILSKGSNDAIAGICVGPDKAIWYTWISSITDFTNQTGRVGRVSSSGQVQEFTVPYPPGSIASGSDGALWYREYLPNADARSENIARKGYIGHITTAGVTSEIPIDPNLDVDRLVTGSDGAIWFPISQDETGKFGRITSSGEVKTFTTGGNSGIVQIVAAPGAIWLLDARNVLWRYRLPA
jgi:virginiamycin B lyase